MINSFLYNKKKNDHLIKVFDSKEQVFSYPSDNMSRHNKIKTN